MLGMVVIRTSGKELYLGKVGNMSDSILNLFVSHLFLRRERHVAKFQGENDHLHVMF